MRSTRPLAATVDSGAPVPEALRVRVAALVQLDSRVLVVRHRKDDAEYHLLPGGGVEPTETLSEALVREVREETGLEVEVGRPVLLADTIAPDGSRRLVNVVFRCDIIAGALTDDPDDPRVVGAELVDVERLPELDLRPPMADAVVRAVQDPAVDCRYLGALWSPHSGDTG
jgi:8-oxo-dGTP diphosphatase